MFIKTGSSPEGKLHLCVAPNQWALQNGAMGIQNDGVPVAVRETVNMVSGAGIMANISDDGSAVTIQQSADTAILQTRADSQSGTALLCRSLETSGTTYTCAIQPTLTEYTTGMVLRWLPETANTGAVTLNVDTLGARAIRSPDGTADLQAGEISAGTLYEIWYDGTKFRRIASGVAASAPPAAPASFLDWPFGPMNAGASSAPNLVSANRLLGMTFYVAPPGRVINHIRGYTHTNGDAGDMAWAIYDGACTTLLATTETLQGLSSQARSWSFPSPVTLQPGTYNLVTSSSSASYQLWGSTSGYSPDVANTEEDSSTYTFFYGPSGSNLSSTVDGVTTFPTTCGARTAISSTNYPGIAIR
jgi:hypothetical protein